MSKRVATKSLNSNSRRPKLVSGAEAAVSQTTASTGGTSKNAGNSSSNSNTMMLGGGATMNSTTTIVESLQMLRSFVGENSGFSESDLSTCLRQSGYVVDVAAERLMTGQYQPSSKKSHNINHKSKSSKLKHNHTNIDDEGDHYNDGISSSETMTVTTTPQQQKVPSHSSTTTTQRVNHDNAASLCSTVEVAAAGLEFCQGMEKTPSHISRWDHRNSNLLSSTASMVTPKSNASVTTTPITATVDKSSSSLQSGWLLCQRWISDGVNLQRNGSCRYQEEFYIQDAVVPSAATSPTMNENDKSTSPSEAVQQQQQHQQQRPTVVNHSSLRFRSSSNKMQGHFPRDLATILSPLLRCNLIRLQIAALMEEQNLNIGAQIAVSIR